MGHYKQYPGHFDLLTCFLFLTCAYFGFAPHCSAVDISMIPTINLFTFLALCTFWISTLLLIIFILHAFYIFALFLLFTAPVVLTAVTSKIKNVSDIRTFGSCYTTMKHKPTNLLNQIKLLDIVS